MGGGMLGDFREIIEQIRAPEAHIGLKAAKTQSIDRLFWCIYRPRDGHGHFRAISTPVG